MGAPRRGKDNREEEWRSWGFTQLRRRLDLSSQRTPGTLEVGGPGPLGQGAATDEPAWGLCTLGAHSRGAAWGLHTLRPTVERQQGPIWRTLLRVATSA